MTTIIFGILEEGLVYAIMALGVYITYKILDFPDLSVDGTFPLGAAVTAAGIANGLPFIGTISPVAALFISFTVGALAGCITGLIHVKLKVRDLLSGIIVMTALYSINLRIAGKANLPIFSKETIFSNSFLSAHVPEAASPFIVTIILFVIVMICKVLLDAYLQTRSGYLLRAVGDNDVLVTSLAKDKGLVKIVGLAIANGFAALAGSVYCQQKGFFEISIGTGTMVIGLANVIIGTQLLKRVGFIRSTTAVIIGSIVYKACVSIALLLNDLHIAGLDLSIPVTASDLKLITSVLFLIILVVSPSGGKKVKIHA
ncbi:ABC transporter permease [Clostridium sp. AM51-4]|jgi:putative tryptophan/tyrosine transport system permease protein|nr:MULTISPECIES: ABC transporter permease [unclassified Clostridium]RHQ07681.1 ABC transporter permease [Clostridium sp. AM51-4]RHV53630.1 ABC transporter permease [Clostridium sp. OM04-12AA]